MEATVDMWTREDEIQFTRMEAHREGRIEGEKIGEKKGKKNGILETAKNLLVEGLPIELIMKVTKLSKKEIQKFNKVKN